MKANATSSGRMAACNPNSPTSDLPASGRTDLSHPGLISHPTLTPSVQVQILSVVDATGSASIGDIIADLPGHNDPVSAIFALVAAGVLVVLSEGIIDAHTVLARRLPSDQPGDPVPVDAAPSPVPSSENLEDKLATAQWSDFVGDAVAELPPELVQVPASSLQPRILRGSGRHRAAFKYAVGLQQPGVYIQLCGNEAYVGYGGDVGLRIAMGKQMDSLPDTILVITDASNGLSEEDGLALERILWAYVSDDADFTVVNKQPDGAPISVERYDQLVQFTAQVVLALRQADIMFLQGSVRQRLAGPRAEPDRLGAVRPFDSIPEGRVMELNYRGLTALAAERDDGTWLLLRGSDVRIDTVKSASANASFQRAAWLHSGLLELAGDGSCYVLMRDVVFSSGSAVGHFVSGSKGFGLSCWQPIDPDDCEIDALAL